MKIPAIIILLGAVCSLTNAAPMVGDVVRAGELDVRGTGLEGTPFALAWLAYMVLERPGELKNFMEGTEEGWKFSKFLPHVLGPHALIGDIGLVTKALEKTDPALAEKALAYIKSIRSAAYNDVLEATRPAGGHVAIAAT
ncbi:hypothetical protein MJO29_005749 [Puccinia striiformis f. sp. tritici]|uniref:hypothetical protein n=1 Tax=Puccinia striiformis f. sp. tritici TaxID=168172 RepID=UPI000A1238C0|nr:hypothetical protein Pst134EA_009840 [Puccinia striiformis f. sp. tritici]KAH9469319.1 hypothetical protein Pst134EA_009840 [Puccinia striiformis f. sp. tritici]KAI7960681.1 hypothetical protein MJO29_005749 [Puccinia striiformis f. sp. tritici]KAI9621364.1 hypothetical protein KEM48_007766 [Puccinia striiformis f. sp. tritici PST-130]